MKGIRFWSPQFYLLGLAICLSSWYSCDPVDYQNASSLVFSSSTIHSNHSNLSLPYSSSLIPWSDFWQLSHLTLFAMSGTDICIQKIPYRSLHWSLLIILSSPVLLNFQSCNILGPNISTLPLLVSL